MRRITEMFVFVTIDEEGNEEVCGIRTSSGWIPMIGVDSAMVAKLMPRARELAHETIHPIQLIRFTVREQIVSLPS